MTLPAFAAERERLQAAADIDRYLLPAPALSSKPAAAARRCCYRSPRQRDGR